MGGCPGPVRGRIFANRRERGNGMDYYIAPSLLSADFGRLAEEVGAVEKAGADLLHVDIMDGRFVPNITIGPPVVAAIKRCAKLPLDVHLMIVEPERYIEAFADAGADVLTVHAEATPHLQRVVARVRELGKKAGVSLNPSTSLSAIEWVLTDIDMVLLMSVNPGFGGQEYLPSMTGKIELLRSQLVRSGLPVDIEVDGGIKTDNVAEVVRAGANVIVSGSGIFKTKDYGKTISEMRDNIRKAVSASA
jgi:ribulose-phosphate 3-epimerase